MLRAAGNHPKGEPQMPAELVDRRRFVQQAAAGGAALALPAWCRASAADANSRLGIGMIGVGDRGSALTRQILALAGEHEVDIVAVCDVWQVNLSRAAERISDALGRRPAAVTRYADLLAMDQVDAVVIATPDFSHGPILVDALRAGKEVYVEKPMAIDLAEANEALDLARRANRVVQAGTQYRSHGGYTAAARELASGVLGRIHRISASANFNGARWARDYSDCRAADVDWEAFLLNRPTRPFDPKLLRRWQLYREFTNGVPGLWMSHYADAVHLLTGARYPASAVALGGNYVWHDGREHCDTFHALLEYPEGFLFDWSMCLGNSAGTEFRVYGTGGTLDLGRNYATPTGLILSSEGASQPTKLAKRAIQPDPNQDHMANWLACLRSRQRPNADIEYGHQHAVATILAARACESGRRQRYDSARGEMLVG